MALTSTIGRRVGLLSAEPSRGAGLATALLHTGLLACIYAVRRAEGEQGHPALAQHLHQALTTPLRYLVAAGQALATRRGPAFLAAVRIAAECRSDRVAHLHACDEASSEVAQWVAGFVGIGFSVTLPARLSPTAQKAPLSRRLCAARFVLAASDAGVRAAAAFAPRAELRRAYPGVDYRHFSPRLRRPAARIPLVLAVGSTGDGEGLALVVEACRRLVQQGVELRCDIVCDHADTARTEAGVDEAKLNDRVRVLGPVSASHLADRLARATFYVQAPRGAGIDATIDIPAELLQAMAMGLPVLAERTPLWAECIVHGDSGWLFTAGDAAALAHGLQHLLSTARLGEQLGKQARARVLEQFDSEVNLRNVRVWLEQAHCSAPVSALQSTRRPLQAQGLHRA